MLCLLRHRAHRQSAEQGRFQSGATTADSRSLPDLKVLSPAAPFSVCGGAKSPHLLAFIAVLGDIHQKVARQEVAAD